MIPELGHFALILALCAALVQGIVPLCGAQFGKRNWMALAQSATWTTAALMALSFACLLYAFIVNDFTVSYVARNSNTDLPLIYRISAVWGAHEGSLLLWALILGLWGAAVAARCREMPQEMLARALSVIGLLCVGFLLFMLFTSNPFERLLPAPMDGRDLNPLLQDFGLAIHPPMLYMGYVGFAVPFAFAIAALLGGQLDTAWARWSRPWTITAWLFLTIGIALGSWWAYYELGWGGWWFWDPVENASFLPWLVGTALMHSLVATEKRGAFKAWTVLLAVFTFSLSLLGTFLVRSGVLTSVHAFATDPARGVFILAFLGIVVGGSLLLYSWRAPQIRSAVSFDLVSCDMALLLNNLLLVVTAATILLGTLYPLLLDALGVGKISVGPPYFNAVFVPLTIPLALLLGVAGTVRWKRDSFVRILRELTPAFLLALIIGIAFPWLVMPHYSIGAATGVALAIWIALTTAQSIFHRVEKSSQRWSALGRIPRTFYGMAVAHLGVAVFIVGVTLTSIYSVEKDVRLAPGETYTLAGFEFSFAGVRSITGPNYRGVEGQLEVARDNTHIAILNTQKRIYHAQPQPMTEAAIDAGITRDLFVALGESLGDSGAWSVRLYHKPYIRWIWLGAMLMAFGGVLAASDRRYRLKRPATVEEPARATAVAIN